MHDSTTHDRRTHPQRWTRRRGLLDRPRRCGALAAALAALALLTTAVGPAQAAPTATGGPVVCEEDTPIAHRQVYADVRVPAGGWCTIEKAGIHGDLLVDPGAGVYVARSSVLGDVLGAGGVDLESATVEGDVWLDGWREVATRPARFAASRSTVRGDVRGRGVLWFRDVHVEGAVNVTAPHRQYATRRGSLITDSRIDGWVNLPVLGATVVHVARSDLRSGLTFSGYGNGTVCGTTVADDLVLRTTGAHIRVGAAPRMSNNRCEVGPAAQAVTVGGDLLVRSAGDLVAISQVHVLGDLRCDAPVKVGIVQVDGVRTGTCAEASP